MIKRNNIGHDVKSFIDLMDLDELVKLNEYLVKRIRLLSDTKSMEKVQDFELLEEVYFIDDRRNRIEGTVIRLNKKTITIKTGNGMEWRVSPDFLKRLV
jgi:hypothetical protein